MRIVCQMDLYFPTLHPSAILTYRRRAKRVGKAKPVAAGGTLGNVRLVGNPQSGICWAHMPLELAPE